MYEQPLGLDALAARQALERARLCDRLETMWRGLQADIEEQRHESERGVDPRLQQLQLQTIKMQAQLLRLTGTPMAEPPPEDDPEAARVNAEQVARQMLERVVEKLDEGDGGR
jgi:hypothetical protein